MQEDFNTRELNNAANAILKGGIIAYPTEAVYGLGCDPLNHVALEKLIATKQRDKDKGLILIAGHIEQFYTFIEPDQFDLQSDIKAKWPGAITWLVPCKTNTSTLLSGTHKTLAVRVTKHSFVTALCNKLGHCIVSTSANLSNQAPAVSADDVKKYFPNKQIDYIADAAIGTEKNVSSIFDAQTGKQIR